VIAASGGILANATDLARWWDAVLTGRVVKQSSLDEMLALTELKDLRTVPHGFAFFIDTFNGHKVIQHFGSTVGGFGSIVRYYPKQGITIVVIGNLGDGGFGAEYIAKRVSEKYIPGSFVGGLKNAEDTFPGQTPSHLATLKAIAEKTSAPMLSDTYVPKISDAFRKQLADNLAEMTDFKFLGREIFSPEHFMLDPTAAGVDRYKMTLKAKTVYYHLRFNKERKISWISTEE
jgi:Beta-lactamase class C and other penicillin binding proteins